LKPGEISEPIRQPTAYYIVRLEEKGSQPVDEVREKIIQTIRNDHMNQWMKDMNASYQAVIKDPEFFKASAPAVPPALAPNPKQ
jgi:peptidyl-prolyl cis-trans isomerase C